MFGPLGFYEIVFIMALAFLLLGPKQMSMVSRSMGRTLREFYKMSADVRRQINAERASLEEEMRQGEAPIRETIAEVKRDMKQAERDFGAGISRRGLLGQDETEPSESTKPKVLEVKTPEGLTARGSLGASDDGSAGDAESTSMDGEPEAVPDTGDDATAGKGP